MNWTRNFKKKKKTGISLEAAKEFLKNSDAKEFIVDEGVKLTLEELSDEQVAKAVKVMTGMDVEHA